MKKRIAVFVGRFAPVHNGHIGNIKYCQEHYDETIILIGSSNKRRTLKNPFPILYIENWLKAINPKAIVKPINDYMYNDNKWISQVESVCYTLFDRNECEFTVVGHHKDESSYYLDIFPTWKVHETPEYANGISATEIREVIFNDIDGFSLKEYLRQYTSDFVVDDILNFTQTSLYNTLLEEKKYFEKETQKFASYPYKDTLKFNCSDAVVVCDGNVLLIERLRAPGKGTYALPGGFVNTNETYEQCAIRELYEETNLKIPLKVLKGSLKRSRIFDNPKRNEGFPRITNAFYFEVQPDTTKSGHSKLPKIKGSDDAICAKWFPLAEVRNMILFDDHADIIDWAVNSF